MHRVRGEEEHETITRGRQGNGPPVEAGRGMDAGRGMKVPSDGRTPWVLQGPRRRSMMEKGGQLDKGIHYVCISCFFKPNFFWGTHHAIKKFSYGHL